MDTLRKSKVLSARRGVLMIEERVVRDAVVEGGSVDGFGREGEDGMRIRRCAASVKCTRRGRRAAEMRILMVWFSESGDVAIAFADREGRRGASMDLELLGTESLGEDLAYTCSWPLRYLELWE